MEIMSWSEARARNSKKYFTGKPCKHGHVAERYTVSGGCAECIRQANGDVAAARPTKSAAMERDRVPVRLYVYREDFEQLRDVISKVNQLRWPDAPDHQAGMVKRTPLSANQPGLFVFDAHPLDVETVRAAQNALLSARSAPTHTAIAQAHQRAAQMQAEQDRLHDTTPPLTFNPK